MTGTRTTILFHFNQMHRAKVSRDVRAVKATRTSWTRISRSSKYTPGATRAITQSTVRAGLCSHMERLSDLTLAESGGYQLTPADGGPLQGRCTRDAGNDYHYTDVLTNLRGTQLFPSSSASPKKREFTQHEASSTHLD